MKLRAILLGGMLIWAKQVLGVTGEVVVKVTLDPVGHFEVKSKALTFDGVKTEGTVEANEIKVAVDSLTTDMALRDKHLREKLKCEGKAECDFIVLRKMKVINNKTGTGEIMIKGVTKSIDFTVTELSKTAGEANFKLSLKEFQIGGISYRGIGVDDSVEVLVKIGF